MKKNMKTIACGVMSLLLAAPLSASTTESNLVVAQATQSLRKIVSVETINVQSPVGLHYA